MQCRAMQRNNVQRERKRRKNSIVCLCFWFKRIKNHRILEKCLLHTRFATMNWRKLYDDDDSTKKKQLDWLTLNLGFTLCSDVLSQVLHTQTCC